MILRNSLFVQNVLHVTNLRTVYELCQMDGRRVNVAALWNFPIIHIEAKEGHVEQHFSKLYTPNMEN